MVSARRTPASDTCRRLGAAVAGRRRRRADVRVMDHVTPVTGSGYGERASERRGTVEVGVVVVVVVGGGRRR